MTLKEFVERLNKNGGKFNQPPTYNIVVEQYKKTIAITRGVNMSVLLDNYRDTEDNQTRKKRDFLLEKVTKPPFDRATNDFIETTNPKLVTINASENVIEYLANTGFNAFLRTDIIPEKIDDPNAFLVAFTVFKGQNKKPEISPYIVNYENVKEHVKDNYLVFEMKIEDVKAYYFISRKEQGRFYRDEKGKFIVDYNPTTKEGFYVSYEQELIFNPYSQLTGELTRDENGNKFYQSDFDSAVSHAVMAMRAISDREMTRITANLLRVARTKPCVSCHGTGRIKTSTGLHDCNTCEGTGKQSFTANIGEVWNLSNEDLANDNIKLDDIVKFIDPPRGGFEMNQEMFVYHIEQVKDALNMALLQLSQSGTAKDIDREHHTAMINKMAKSLYYNSVLTYVKVCEWFLGDRSKENSIDLPSDFRNSTSRALLENISELKKNGATIGVLMPMYFQLYNSLYANNPIARKITLMLLMYDPLHLYSDMREKQLAAKTDKEYQYSLQLPTILHQIAHEKGEESFLVTQEKALIKEAEGKMDLPTGIELTDDNGRPV